MYEFGPKFIPHGVEKYFCLELIGIKKEYRCGNLATRFVEETFKLAASKGFQVGLIRLNPNFAFVSVC
jgi:hypothetical protein